MEFINICPKVAGYEIHRQKSVAFLCINNEHAEKEIRKTILFSTVSDQILRYIRGVFTFENYYVFILL